MSVKETLEPLDRQKKGLATSEWIVVRGSESRDATSTHLAALIGDRPLEELKALNFKPYCGLGRATIKLPAKPRKGSEDEKGGAEPII
jgi:ligand-binding sensor protein